MAYRFRRNGTKYNASKCIVDGITFDSRKEANRYLELKLLERGGLIKDLELQKDFELLPNQYAPDEIKMLKNGKEKIVKGKLLERRVIYRADFAYIDMATNEQVVEDVKGIKLPEYILKRKMLLYFHGIKLIEI
ncbi:MAG: DUF1064 domain-containing protein [Aeriscardovia sp.]|nr:DUF1064 domain-containing protein [Aeriscardovia sp.]